MINKTAFIFPAFITDYTGKELDFLNENKIDFTDYLTRASNVIGYDLPDFSYEYDQYKNNELLSQIIAYLFSCAISDTLEKRNIPTHFFAGYSMGLYASLYSAKVITLTDGIKIIKSAYDLVNELRVSGKYGMGAIIGLSIDDTESLINKNRFETEIININNKHSIVVAGEKNDIQKLLQKARDEGALSAAELIVNTPYHSKYLLKYEETFSTFVNELQIKDPVCPVISTFDQREIIDASEIKKELVLNLTRKINWYKTMQKLIENNVNEIYECGAGKDLKKIARFINGDYKINSIYK